MPAYPEQICPICQQRFKPLRKDQIYCRHYGSMCRNLANNRKATFYRNQLKPVQERLIVNHKTLQRLTEGQKECVVSKEYLKGAGFDFGFFTHNLRIDERVVQMVYDFGIVGITNDSFKIVRLEANKYATSAG